MSHPPAAMFLNAQVIKSIESELRQPLYQATACEDMALHARIFHMLIARAEEYGMFMAVIDMKTFSATGGAIAVYQKELEIMSSLLEFWPVPQEEDTHLYRLVATLIIPSTSSKE